MCAFGPNVKVRQVGEETYTEPTPAERQMAAEIAAEPLDMQALETSVANNNALWQVVVVKPNGRYDLVTIRRPRYWRDEDGVHTGAELRRYSAPRHEHNFSVGAYVELGSYYRRYWMFFRTTATTMYTTYAREWVERGTNRRR